MQDFPPEIRAYSARDAAQPDTRSPRHFLWWIVRLEGSLAALGMLMAMVWMLPQILGPWMVGRAIDDGIVSGDSGATMQWLLALLAVTVAGAAPSLPRRAEMERLRDA